MVQFLLIAMIAPPFLIMGWYGFGGSEPSRGGGPGHLAARAFTHPLVTLALFGAALGWTHWPPAVDALMVSQAGSLLLDLTWLGAGVLFWWPVVGPVGGREWLTDPIRMGYLFLGGVVSTGVFAYLTFSELPLYATYELAPPISSLSSRDDQLVAGLLMKGGGALVLWTWISVLFFRWYRAEGREPGPRPS
jgi:cytochrome c oxidase assembly factor CtaG